MNNYILFIVAGLYIGTGSCPLFAQVNIKKKNQYSSVEISNLKQNLEVINVKFSNQKNLLKQKEFADYDDAINCVKEFNNITQDISKCLKNVSNKYERDFSDRITHADLEHLKNQLSNVIAYSNNLIHDLQTWNPTITNRPLNKTPEQLLEETDPCPLGDCGSCDFPVTDCSDDFLASEAARESCEREAARQDFLLAQCKSELLVCMALQIMKQMKCIELHTGPNLNI